MKVLLINGSPRENGCTYTALSEVEKTLQKNGIEKTCYIVNKVRADLMAQNLVPGLNEITDILSGRMIGVIQFDDNIYISTNRGIPIVTKEGSYIEENFQNIKRRFIEEGKQ